MKLPPEFNDVLAVLEFGAKKYSADGWLEPSGIGMDNSSQMASMARHLAQAVYGDSLDRETGLHHSLHLACRALMLYTRYARGIEHPKDAEEIPGPNDITDWQIKWQFSPIAEDW